VIKAILLLELTRRGTGISKRIKRELKPVQCKLCLNYLKLFDENRYILFFLNFQSFFHRETLSQNDEYNNDYKQFVKQI